MAEVDLANKLTFTAKLSEAKSLKSAGNDLYKSGEVKKALGKYHRALLYIKGIESDINDKANLPLAPESIQSSGFKPSEDQLAELSTFTASVYNNLAAALLALPDSDPEKVLQYTEEVLAFESRNEKAWHRRGVAYYRLKNHTKCHEALTKSVEISQSKVADAKTKEMLQICAKKMEKDKEVQKEMCKKMFDL